MEQYFNSEQHQFCSPNLANGACYLSPLPDLTPAYQQVEGQPVRFTHQALSIIEKANTSSVVISPAQFASDHIVDRIKMGIECGAFDAQRVAKLLVKADNSTDITAFIDDISQDIIKRLSIPLVESILPCQTALESLRYDFSDMEIGKISMRNLTSTDLVFYIDESFKLWEFDISHLSSPVFETVVTCLRSFGRLAHIDTASHETQDWEIYYSIEQLSPKRFNNLKNISFHGDNDDIFSEIKKAMGKVAYDDLLCTLNDYFDDEGDEKAYKGFVIEKIDQLIDEVQFDKQVIFSDKCIYSNSRFNKLKNCIKRTFKKTKNKKEQNLLNALFDLTKAAYPFISCIKGELEWEGDVGLSQQQYMHFTELNDHICEPRIEEIANRLMETGEVSLLILDPKNAEHIAMFNNIQIGYLLMHAATQLVRKL